MTGISDFLAMPPGSNVDPAHVPGFLVMSSVPDRMVEHRQLLVLWTSEALPARYIPKDRRPMDAFMQACKDVSTNRRDSERTHDIKVDRVTASNDNDECVYQVTYMERDKAAQLINHPPAMRVTFNKMRGDIRYFDLTHGNNGSAAPVGSIHDPALEAIRDKIAANFAVYVDQVPGGTLRAAVRGVIERELHGTKMRKSGGAYFVPAAGLKQLQAMERVLGALFNGDADLDMWPMIDTRKTRVKLQKHHEVDMTDRISDLMATVTEKLDGGGGVRRDMLGNVIQERIMLKEQRERMAQLIGKHTSTVDGALRMLDEQINELMALAATKKVA